MPTNLDGNDILSLEELAALARKVRKEAGDRQEEAAAKLRVDQAQVSRAENGDVSYSSVCVRMIEAYTDYSVEYPLYRITRQEV